MTTSDQISIGYHYTKVVEFANRDCLSYLWHEKPDFMGKFCLKIIEWIQAYLFIYYLDASV